MKLRLQSKGQIISEWFFGVFDFLQKTNENKSTWGIIVVNSNSFIHFLEEIKDTKNHFEIIWPLTINFICLFKFFIHLHNWGHAFFVKHRKKAKKKPPKISYHIQYSLCNVLRILTQIFKRAHISNSFSVYLVLGP